MSRYYVRNGIHYGTADEMIDLIEELEAKLADRLEIMRLEAKLAKAVEGLRFYGGVMPVSFSPGQDGGAKARTTLAELKGSKDE